jgi:hypothetical protein
MKDIETLNVSMSSKFKDLERELNLVKLQNQRLTLKIARGAPYYQIIA